MNCEHCYKTGFNKLFRCLDCYNDSEPSDMCSLCMMEHLDANYGNETNFKSIGDSIK